MEIIKTDMFWLRKVNNIVNFKLSDKLNIRKIDL